MKVPIPLQVIDKDSIGRVLHLPYNPAAQLSTQAIALRKLGLDVDYCIYDNYFLKYPTPGMLPVPTSYIDFFNDNLHKYDIFHFHGGQTFFGWYDHQDLPILKEHNKTTIMTFWGSEIRSLSKAMKYNPWVKVKISDENWIHNNLTFLSKYIDKVIISDYEMYGYIKDYFKEIYWVRACVDYENLCANYPNIATQVPHIIHAPTSPVIKGTQFIQKAVKELATTHKFKYTEIQNLSNDKALLAYKKSDIIVDQILIGSHGILAIEAMFLGKPVITYIRDDLRFQFTDEFPIVSANPDTIKDRLQELIEDPQLRNMLGKKGRKYAEENHSPEIIARQLASIYKNCHIDISNNKEKITISEVKKTTICLNMIVKNESKVIERCLNSLKKHIDYWVISDTGSTDDTKEKILNIMQDIPGELIDVPWINFAHNRSAVLTAAKGKADYHLIIDADETFSATEGFKNSLIQDCISGNVRYINGFQFGRVMFLKDDREWRYRGVVHNYAFTDKAATAATIDCVEIVHHCDGSSHENAKDKYLRNARLLEDEVTKNPLDTRSAFYIGESYRDADEHEKAIVAYRKRIAMGGWEEEIYWSYYQIALLSKDLDRYFDAFEYRPSRIEAMYVVGILFYRANKLNSSRLIFESIVNHPAPNDRLFLDTGLHAWKCKDQLALIYYKMGFYQESLDIYEALLGSFAPEAQHGRIEKNIAFCNDRLKGKT